MTIGQEPLFIKIAVLENAIEAQLLSSETLAESRAQAADIHGDEPDGWLRCGADRLHRPAFGKRAAGPEQLTGMDPLPGNPLYHDRRAVRTDLFEGFDFGRGRGRGRVPAGGFCRGEVAREKPLDF